jgi:hypothetical protein
MEASGRGSRFEDYNLVESYFHSAQVLIAHFREVVNGHLPLLAECAEGPISRPVDVDNEEAAYLEMVRREVTGLGKLSLAPKTHPTANVTDAFVRVLCTSSTFKAQIRKLVVLVSSDLLSELESVSSIHKGVR